MSNAARDPTPPADPTASDDLGPADARGTGAPGDALPEYSERIARTIDDAARLLDDASVFHDAASLLEAAREQLDTWQAQLTEPTNLRAVERDVADQLAILTLRESARAASWQAETRDAQADAIQRQRDRRASREDSRRRAAEVSRRLEELPPESERDAYRRFLDAVRDSYLSMANDDELERVLHAIDMERVRVNRAVGSAARTSARRMRRRRTSLRLARYARHLVRFAVSFGCFAYGIDQLASGAPQRGGLSLVVAFAIWLLGRPLEAWLERRQDQAYLSWIARFVERVAWARWSTEFGLRLDERLRARAPGRDDEDADETESKAASPAPADPAATDESP